MEAGGCRPIYSADTARHPNRGSLARAKYSAPKALETLPETAGFGDQRGGGAAELVA